MKSKYTGISNGVLYDLQNVNFDTMNGLCDIEGYNRPQWCLFEEILSSDSMHIRLLKAGIEVIHSESKKPNEAKLRYNGKTIFRGYANNCVYACKTAFNLDI